ncbi:hypothetical protein V466_27900 [Pseudomonas mandelii PD30]|uniref:Uncharacterized protein n=1 Tax=Pseudomonas mandelii PD30 TaxID=1419583 RepID=A0A059KV64_9PSED|nr:hypothetical protein [Pseudomonas mandelii]KDD65720.1 hypothetical protein V466_27900 [Pseudomonas mandelii PD30]
MSGTKLTPEKITSPFQLMAAWFSMLVLIVAALLGGAASISRPEWVAGYLVIFATATILIVIICVLLMLTKYRPHLQDGTDYAQWLKDTGTYSEGMIFKDVAVASSAETGATDDDVVEADECKSADVESDTHKAVGKDGCSVDVIDLPRAVEIVEALKNKGFNASIFDRSPKFNDKSTDKQESIWIGCRLTPAVVIEAMKVAISVWPHLKYLQLSDDNYNPPDFVHDQIFIGGATSTAIDRGLSAWSRREIMMLDEGMSIQDFHELVNSRGENSLRNVV